MTPLSPTFRALNREATLTKQMLGAGATHIYRANYALHGVYFQAFTGLSVGLERLGKLCVILDHAINHSGSFPVDKEMKDLSHDLMKLYARSQVIKTARGLRFRSLQDLSDPDHLSILDVLSSFARGDRYANIDLLSGRTTSKDPIAAWASKVDAKLYQDRVSPKRKSMIEEKAGKSAFMDELASVLHTAEDGTPVTSYEDGVRRTLKHEAIAPYRQLLVLQIIRYWIDLLDGLEVLAREVMPNDIPCFSDILGPLANDDAYIRSRKTWDKV
ncbi:hypothetical protein ACN9MB_13530 [Dyella kyungheensis]|uniref:hypothetical protein n=1 Tax=Dyella kyungheensis TaxID=1242174 RepID=UPI003CF0A0F5